MVERAEMEGGRETEERGEREKKRDGTGIEKDSRREGPTSVLHGTLADVVQCDWTHCHISPGRTISRIFNNNS